MDATRRTKVGPSEKQSGLIKVREGPSGSGNGVNLSESWKYHSTCTVDVDLSSSGQGYSVTKPAKRRGVRAGPPGLRKGPSQSSATEVEATYDREGTGQWEGEEAHEGSERKHGEGWGMPFQRFHMYWGGTFEFLVTGGDSGTKSPQRGDEEGRRALE